MPSTHNKDKPWDTDDIDKWKVEKFNPEDNVGGSFTEESAFTFVFPKYREVYLREAWPVITSALKRHQIACELDLVSGSMSVKTTLKTYDPAAILNARDLIRLLARSVPAPQALRILEDGIACDIIKIRNLVNNDDTFVKRRQRLLGPNGSTLEALEMLTDTYIMVQGGTVAAMGPYKGLKEVRRVAEDCMHNIHPIYKLKQLMTKRDLMQDPTMANESWAAYMPDSKKQTLSKRRVPHKVRNTAKKTYTPFPPAPERSKMDIELENSSYFVSKAAKKRAEEEAREERTREKMEAKKRAREQEYVAPEDNEGEKKRKKKKRKTAEAEE